MFYYAVWKLIQNLISQCKYDFCTMFSIWVKTKKSRNFAVVFYPLNTFKGTKNTCRLVFNILQYIGKSIESERDRPGLRLLSKKSFNWSGKYSNQTEEMVYSSVWFSNVVFKQFIWSICLELRKMQVA